MSDEQVRKVSMKDIHLVQDLIERCLQLYMTQKEVVNTLLANAKIEPCFTELVWQKLEEENKEFFKAYHVRLILKDQISRFNQLLEKQVDVMQELLSPTGVSPVPLSNGSNIQSMLHNSAYHAPQLPGMHHGYTPTPNVYTNGAAVVQPSMQVPAPNMHHDYTPIPNVYTNGASLLQPSVLVGVNMTGHVGMVGVSGNGLLAQVPNAGMVQPYAGNQPFMFGAADNYNLRHHNAVVEAPIAHPFNGGESSSQTLNETDMNLLGIFGHIPRNFSLSDLTTDFCNNTDPNFTDPHIQSAHQGFRILDTNANFTNPHIRSAQQGVRRLDPISEDFGSDPMN